MAWIHRIGLTSAYYLLPSVGFLGHAADYRPDLDARWRDDFPEACDRAADWGIKLHGRLAASYRRMHEGAPGQRTTSRIAALIDLLVARPAMSADKAGQSLGITAHAARGLLGRLEKKGLVQELTGRGSFRLYGLPS
jgi:Fic family protein